MESVMVLTLYRMAKGGLKPPLARVEAW
jgi:hypothetical protein